MENKSQNWRNYKLEDDEVELLESVENGQWKSVGDIENRRNKLREFFAKPEELKNSININLAKEDLQIIIDKGNQYGLNYKDLIEKLVHNFATGKIVL